MAVLPIAAALSLVVGGVQATDVGFHLTAGRTPPRATPDTSVGIRLTRSDDDEPGPWEVWAALASDYRTETKSAGGTGRIGIARKFGRYVRPELQLGTGAYLGDRQTINLIRLGARFELPLGAITPYLYAAFAHQHEMAYADAVMDPLGSAVGLSDHGEIHRSGADLGLGLALNLPRSERDSKQLRLGLRGSWLYLLGTGPRSAVDVVLSVGVGF